MVQKTSQSNKSRFTTESEFPFLPILQSDVLWAPYRAAARMMGQTEHNIALMVHANRKLADTIREIVRREQDILLGLSEKMMREGAELGDGKASSAPFEAYQTTMAGVREIGQAVAEAQAESLEALREYSQSAMAAGRKLGEEFRTAA